MKSPSELLLLSLVFSGLVFLAPGCRQRGDPVRKTLYEIASAAENRDANAVTARLASSFQGPEGETRDQVALELKRYFFAYESLGVTLSDVVIENGPSRARAFFRAELSGNLRQIGGLDGILPRSSQWKFEVTLILETGQWKILEAHWERLS